MGLRYGSLEEGLLAIERGIIPESREKNYEGAYNAGAIPKTPGGDPELSEDRIGGAVLTYQGRPRGEWVYTGSDTDTYEQWVSGEIETPVFEAMTPAREGTDALRDPGTSPDQATTPEPQSPQDTTAESQPETTDSTDSSGASMAPSVNVSDRALIAGAIGVGIAIYALGGDS